MPTISCWLLSCAIALLPLAADAQIAPAPPANPADTGSGPRFEAAKQKHLEHLERITNCVRQAQSFEAMRACHPQHR